MGIALSWDNAQQTIILLDYERPWNWDEFDRTANDLINMLSQVDHKVHIIFDVSHAGMPPGGALTRFKRVLELNHPNTGRLVFVSSPSIMTFINIVRNALQKINPGRDDAPQFEFARTLAEARTKLAEITQSQEDCDDTDAPT
ncbi:MAG: hypothetical protein CL607_10610 [Anaerolineaceae bacterium]|nr:hypothetical protein [Anaerolineaceae bacterium]